MRIDGALCLRAFQIPFGDLSVKWFTVVKFDPGMQIKRVYFSIGGNLPGFCQSRDNLPLIVYLGQGFIKI